VRLEPSSARTVSASDVDASRQRPTPRRPADPSLKWLTAPEAAFAYGLRTVKALYSAADRGSVKSKSFGERGRRYLNPNHEP